MKKKKLEVKHIIIGKGNATWSWESKRGKPRYKKVDTITLIYG